MAREVGSTTRRIALLLALLAAAMAIFMGALPIISPETFISAEQLEAVQQFFQKTNTSLDEPAPRASRASVHTNNWAVLVCTSKFWFNYRHMANVLGMYRTVKRLGMPDSHIILMLADDAACNARNHYPGSVWSESHHNIDLYGDDVEVDYRGYEVTVPNLLRLLTGRVPVHTPRSKKLESDEHSNVFLYMTGHGGDEFLKFQDAEEISAYDLADAIEQMWEKRRYHELLFMIDTCQASTMGSRIYSPNVLAMSSSVKGQNSYSFSNDYAVGVPLIDRYTRAVLEYMESVNRTSSQTLQDLSSYLEGQNIYSTPTVREDLYGKPLKDVKVTNFFGAVAQVQLT
ncbi:glycosylphosphatidylinositol anchor biosynthesis [Malassezia caprae]|uniref:Glycosylphosphatidylinositol anchor biosynthesis n=1 Tax=Malassezia caprae TaxID=1381934 RepID=A0AAF0EB70_9BASI|nr:glycosylphosphatidylinositol anchor biosynthesis [Malassezia caprae]